MQKKEDEEKKWFECVGRTASGDAETVGLRNSRQFNNLQPPRQLGLRRRR